MTSTLRATGGLALAVWLLAGCSIPSIVRQRPEPVPVMVSAQPAPGPGNIGRSAIALPPQEPIPDATASLLDPASSSEGLDACRGRNPAMEAQATQGVSAANPANPYTGKDTYNNVVVKKGMIFYSLTPGAPPGFAVTWQTLTSAGGNLMNYYDLVQVTTDPGRDAAGLPRKLRNQVRLFRVTEDMCVARGIATANPQFGRGGGTQYYVSPADVAKLSPGESRPIEQATSSTQ